MKTFSPFPAMAGLALCSALLADGGSFSQNKGAAAVLANPADANRPTSAETQAVVIGIPEKSPACAFTGKAKG